MSYDPNPLLVDHDRRRAEQRHHGEPFDWLCSLERPTRRTDRLFRRLASIVAR